VGSRTHNHVKTAHRQNAEKLKVALEMELGVKKQASGGEAAGLPDQRNETLHAAGIVIERLPERFTQQPLLDANAH
jgi:hypothetical protein